jgi:hypothetical protein
MATDPEIPDSFPGGNKFYEKDLLCIQCSEFMVADFLSAG